MPSGPLAIAHPVIYGLLIFFAFIEGCDTSYLTSKFNAGNSWPNGSIRDRTKFLVFTSWWTVVFFTLQLVFFMIAPESIVSSVLSHNIIMGLTWFFWLCGAAAITAALGGGQRCSQSDLTYCGQLVASEGFAWIEWIIMTVAFAYILFTSFKAFRRGDGLTGSLSV